MFSRRSSLARTHLRALPGGASSQDTPAPPTDEALLDAIARGDDRIAGHLYDRLFHVVDRGVYRIMGSRDFDHHDLVQATFEQIVLTIRRGSYGRGCSLQTWATAIASRVGLNALRARRRERSALDTVANYELPQLTTRDVEAELDARAEIERLRTELVAMKAVQAEAVYLHDVLGYELTDIATITGASIAAAQSRLVRGRKELLRRMKRCHSKREARP
jgi:RNA polymerase sigma-70 factor (ECF subfamily)